MCCVVPLTQCDLDELPALPACHGCCLGSLRVLVTALPVLPSSSQASTKAEVEAQLRALMGAHGPLSSLLVYTRPDGSLKGDALVVFQRSHHAEA